MGVLRRRLDIVRINVAASDDDEVFQPAADVQLAVMKESEIAGPEERPVAVGRDSTKRLLGFHRSVPVASRHIVAGDPDFPDLIVRTDSPSLRIDNANALDSRGRTAARERLRCARVNGHARHYQTFLQRCSVND